MGVANRKERLGVVIVNTQLIKGELANKKGATRQVTRINSFSSSPNLDFEKEKSVKSVSLRFSKS